MSFDNEEILDTEKMEVLRVNPTDVETRDHSHFKSIFWSLLKITQLSRKCNKFVYFLYSKSVCLKLPFPRHIICNYNEAIVLHVLL